MRDALCFLVALIFVIQAVPIDAQQETGKYATSVRPVAFDRNYALSSPQKPFQIFIVESVNADKELFQLVYFPRTNGLRGSEGTTRFVEVSKLHGDVLWSVDLRNPTANESAFCVKENYTRGSVHLDSTKLPPRPIRFRSIQFDAYIEFIALKEMPCLVLNSSDPPESVNVTGKP